MHFMMKESVPKIDFTTVNVRLPKSDYERLRKVVEKLPSGSNANNFVVKCVQSCLDMIETSPGDAPKLPQFLGVCKYAVNYDEEVTVR